MARDARPRSPTLGVRAAAIGYSGQMHGLVVQDDAGPRAAARDPLERPAHRRRVRGDRGAPRRRAADRADREPRADGFTAPKLLWLRKHEPETYARIPHVLLPKDYVRFRLTGERAIDVADASGTLLFDVAHRRWSDEVLAALELPREWLPPGARVDGDRRRGRPGGRRARRRRRPARARSRSCSARPASSSRRCTSTAPEPEARLHTFCHAVPDTWHAMGVMLSAAGSLQWLRGALGGASVRRAARGGGALGAGRRGAALPAVPRGRADPARRSGRARRVRRALAPPRPRCARPGGARGRRLRPARLARAAAERRRRGRGRPPLGRRRTRRAVGADRRLRARPAARANDRRRGRCVRRGAAGGVAAGTFADAHEAVERCVRVRDRIEPDPVWVEAYEEGYARYRRLYPALKKL